MWHPRPTLERNNLASARAWSSESFSPASKVYSNVTRRPVAFLYILTSSSSASSGNALAEGMSLSLNSWVGACNETARVACNRCAASLDNALGTPTVDIVKYRPPMPTSRLRQR